MLIIIIGPCCAGKSTVEHYLARHKGFQVLQLAQPLNDSHYAARPTLSSEQDDNLQTAESFATTATKASTEASPAPLQPAIQALHMRSISYMLDYVTRNWQTDFVTIQLDGTRPDVLAQFTRRPFCAVLYVDAPIMIRWERSRARARLGQSHGPTLEEFIAQNDRLVFGQSSFDTASHGSVNTPLPELPVYIQSTSSTPSLEKSGLRPTPSFNASAHLVTLRVSDIYTTQAALFAHLDELDIVRSDRLRPTWDDYFMTLAELAARRSNCMKRRVGAILVRAHRIVATGYNGTARGLNNCNAGGCPACNLRRVPGEEKLNECICLHAEENALLEAGRDRASGWPGESTTLYCNTCPCLRCSVKIVQSGVMEVVYNNSYKVDEASAALFQEAGVNLRRYEPLPPVHH